MTAIKGKRAKEVPEHVGRQMRKWRKVAEMSLEEVAEIIGTTKGNLSGVENGKGNLSVPLFLAYCQAIKTPVSKVLEERLLSKNQDVDRLAAAIVEHNGRRDLEWLAGLTKAEYRAAMQAARDRVDLDRMRSHPRSDETRTKAK